MQGDAIRPITADWLAGFTNETDGGSGAVYMIAESSRNPMIQNNSGGRFYFDSSRVVPTGPENSPRTLSRNYYLRIT